MNTNETIAAKNETETKQARTRKELIIEMAVCLRIASLAV